MIIDSPTSGTPTATDGPIGIAVRSGRIKREDKFDDIDPF